MFLGRTCAAASGANYMLGSWDLVPDCVTYTELCCTTILGAAFCATAYLANLRLSWWLSDPAAVAQTSMRRWRSARRSGRPTSCAAAPSWRCRTSAAPAPLPWPWMRRR